MSQKAKKQIEAQDRIYLKHLEELKVFPHAKINYCMAAARNGETELIQFMYRKGTKLLEYGLSCPDINEIDLHHKSALDHAIYNNHVETARILIQLGANPNKNTDHILANDRNGASSFNSSLYLASTHANLEMFKLLLESGANPNILIPQTPLAISLMAYFCAQGQYELVNILLDYGADPNLINTQYTKEDTSPLSIMAEKFSSDPIHFKIELELMQKLLDHGAYIDPINPKRLSPLAISLKAKNLYWATEMQIVIFFLEHGANPSLKQNDTQTILEYLKQEARPEDFNEFEKIILNQQNKSSISKVRKIL